MNLRLNFAPFLFLIALMAATPAAGFDEEPTIEKAGGTLLVYEVDTSAGLPDGYKPDAMVKAIKRRLDPSDLFNIRVKAVKDNRIEVGIPRRRDHDKNVKLVKELLAQAGQLEFRIVANEEDDAKAFEAAQKYFAEESIKEELNRLAMAGKVPPPPSGETPDFETAKGKFSYSWVELSRGELPSLNLDDAVEKDDKRNADWLKAAEARKVGKPLVLASAHCLIFSRPCTNGGLSKEEREQKKVDYFILCRDPFKDVKTSKPRAVTGKYLTEVKAVEDKGKRLAVNLRFNNEGGDLFFALTNANQPSGPEGNRLYRHLAIILDGQVMTAPRLHSPIRDQAQISGNFTAKEVEQLVNILRDGALPAPLKPMPVSETAVEPK